MPTPKYPSIESFCRTVSKDGLPAALGYDDTAKRLVDFTRQWLCRAAGDGNVTVIEWLLSLGHPDKAAAALPPPPTATISAACIQAVETFLTEHPEALYAALNENGAEVLVEESAVSRLMAATPHSSASEENDGSSAAEGGDESTHIPLPHIFYQMPSPKGRPADDRTVVMTNPNHRVYYHRLGPFVATTLNRVTPLSIALLCGQVDAVRLLASDPRTDVNTTLLHEVRLLHSAVNMSYRSAVRECVALAALASLISLDGGESSKSARVDLDPVAGAAAGLPADWSQRYVAAEHSDRRYTSQLHLPSAYVPDRKGTPSRALTLAEVFVGGIGSFLTQTLLLRWLQMNPNYSPVTSESPSAETGDAFAEMRLDKDGAAIYLVGRDRQLTLFSLSGFLVETNVPTYPTLASRVPPYVNEAVKGRIFDLFKALCAGGTIAFDASVASSRRPPCLGPRSVWEDGTPTSPSSEENSPANTKDVFARIDRLGIPNEAPMMVPLTLNRVMVASYAAPLGAAREAAYLDTIRAEVRRTKGVEMPYPNTSSRVYTSVMDCLVSKGLPKNLLPSTENNGMAGGVLSYSAAPPTTRFIPHILSSDVTRLPPATVALAKEAAQYIYITIYREQLSPPSLLGAACAADNVALVAFLVERCGVIDGTLGDNDGEGEVSERRVVRHTAAKSEMSSSGILSRVKEIFSKSDDVYSPSNPSNESEAAMAAKLLRRRLRTDPITWELARALLGNAVRNGSVATMLYLLSLRRVEEPKSNSSTDARTAPRIVGARTDHITAYEQTARTIPRYQSKRATRGGDGAYPPLPSPDSPSSPIGGTPTPYTATINAIRYRPQSLRGSYLFTDVNPMNDRAQHALEVAVQQCSVNGECRLAADFLLSMRVVPDTYRPKEDGEEEEQDGAIDGSPYLVDINLQNPSTGMSLLHHAASRGDCDAITMLLRHGADPSEGAGCRTHGCLSGAGADAAASAGDNTNTSKSSTPPFNPFFGLTAMHYAAHGAKREAFAAMADAGGADVNIDICPSCKRYWVEKAGARSGVTVDSLRVTPADIVPKGQLFDDVREHISQQ